METAKKRGALKKLVILILAELLLVAAVVWAFDPFYQYHAPFGSLPAVLTDRDNQVVGTIRNFRYDSVLLGSSVAENFDSDYLDMAYDCSTLKVIRASGSVADLLYYLEMAQEERGIELKNIFWCLDSFAMSASTEVTLYGGDTPRYLHTGSVLDDIPYLFNREVLLERIPYMLACGYQGRNTGGRAYDWSRDKEFSAAKTMQAYDRSGINVVSNVEQRPVGEKAELIEENISLLTRQIAAHPETQYYFILPPYSMLWWDCAYVNGEQEERFYILEQTLPELLAFENVEVYFFQSEEEIVCNLDNYMDMIHYTPQVNQLMLERMASGENRVTSENLETVLTALRDMAHRITREEIYRYYPEQQ